MNENPYVELLELEEVIRKNSEQISLIQANLQEKINTRDSYYQKRNEIEVILNFTLKTSG